MRKLNNSGLGVLEVTLIVAIVALIVWIILAAIKS